MAMSRANKEAEVKALKDKLENSGVVVVTQNLGLNAQATTELRSKSRENGVDYKVAKNTLTRRAVEGTRYASIADFLTGPTALATSEDPVAAAKTVYEFAKGNDKLVIVGGALGEMILDKAAVENLAKLPSLDELRGKLVGLLQAPAGQLARLAQAPGGQLARVINAYATKGE